MTAIRIRLGGLLLCGLAAPLAHGSDAQALLTRMQSAAASLDYDGTFVYQSGGQLESLRIIHKAGSRGTRERLVSLNGAPREIIRTDREVRCYLPDHSNVLIEHRRAEASGFPALIPEAARSVENNYHVHRGKDGRVAGRKVRSVLLKPRDGYRYGYQLWADETTGLLLRAGLFDEHGAVIEQYMFTQVAIGQPIAEAALAPQFSGREVAVPRVIDRPAAAPAGAWAARQLPPGFGLTARVQRRLPGYDQSVEHLVYSDGLAVVSVFIERAAGADGPAAIDGLTRMGAVHAFGKRVDGFRITVVGETPAATVAMIGESVAREP